MFIFKISEDGELIVVKMKVSVQYKVENIAGYQHFSPWKFSNTVTFRVVKSRSCVVKDQTF